MCINLTSDNTASLVRCVCNNVTEWGRSDTIADATEPRNLCYDRCKTIFPVVAKFQACLLQSSTGGH